jgi:SAM-dependent methyltransferase
MVTTRYGEPLAAGGFDSPAAERNKEPILRVLQRVLPPTGTVLEIASGTGQHAVHFARALPRLTWQPSEPDADLRAVIAARIAAAAAPNLRAPLTLDVLDARWPNVAADAIVCINMIHIAPAAATDALFRHAARLLGPGAPLVLYGPFKIGGAHTAPSNDAFDRSLRARNAEWGVRDLADVARAASAHAIELVGTEALPANNLAVELRAGAAR